VNWGRRRRPCRAGRERGGVPAGQLVRCPPLAGRASIAPRPGAAGEQLTGKVATVGVVDEFAVVVREAQGLTLLEAAARNRWQPATKRPLFLSFPYVCPEPVLVKSSF